ncbi:MAG: 2-oxoglutarate dehydrogenase, E2 component, dihydrolipoamide succinyltransferase [Terracidiphilus sp.]|jgi:2-oxoglutarate dehydrogenase E2 component (dihydrolipoamide succinyltransferase)
MPTDVIMPQMGESIFEGTITKWLKKTGDQVQKDEPLFEISTDKVDAEIPSPIAGILGEIRAPEGATVEINTVVAVITEAGEAGSTAEAVVPNPIASPAPHQVPPEAASAPSQAPNPLSMQDGTEVVMPQMGESIFEGTITKWLKKTGDLVQKDEPLFEISTDKVDAEIPSPSTGVLLEIKALEGETVAINTVVAVIGAPGSAPAAPTPAAPAKPIAPVAAKPPAPAEPPAPQASAGKIRSSPLVRRIAKDNGVDLSRIAGSGSEGRITKDDILRHLSEHGPGSAPVSSPAAPPPALSGDLVPMTKMRAIIAQRMVESLVISPHVHSVFKVDMTRIVKLREREKTAFEQRHGVKLTYMPFIAAAVIETLRKFPIVNASLENGSIRYHDHIHLGIAVALEWGLIVPVVKQAETQSFVDLARAINDLAARARTKKLKPDEASGSTFTLTNSGIFGEEFGTPIINQPESAILAIGGLKKEAVVLTDAEGDDTIAIRSMQHICLGFDHRTIDGADAGKFMGELKKTLENWNKAIS